LKKTGIAPVVLQPRKRFGVRGIARLRELMLLFRLCKTAPRQAATTSNVFAPQIFCQDKKIFRLRCNCGGPASGKPIGLPFYCVDTVKRSVAKASSFAQGYGG